MTQSSQSSRVSVIPVTISTNGFVWSCRTRAPIGLKTDGLRTLPSRASAVFESASYLPTAVGKLRTAIERTNSLVALAVRPFISRKLRLILQFGTGPVSTAGKCFSFLRALHQDPAKSLGVAGILFTPFNQHRLPKSAGLSGLVSASDTHRDTERKRSWVTSDGSNLT